MLQPQCPYRLRTLTHAIVAWSLPSPDRAKRPGSGPGDDRRPEINRKVAAQRRLRDRWSATNLGRGGCKRQGVSGTPDLRFGDIRARSIGDLTKLRG